MKNSNTDLINLNQLTRRDFLKLCGSASIAAILAACGVTPTPTATPAPTNTVLPTSIALPTATPTLTNTPAPMNTATPTPTSVPAYSVDQMGFPGVPKIENRAEWQTAARLSIERYAKTLGIDPESIQLTIKGYKDNIGNSHALAETSNGTPLLIATQDPKSGEWGWGGKPEEILALGAKLNGLENYGLSGVDPSQGDNYSDSRINLYPRSHSNDWGPNWILRNGPTVSPDFRATDRFINNFLANGVKPAYGIGFPVKPAYFNSLLADPKFSKMSPKEWREMVLNYNTTVAQRFPSIDEWLVANEITLPDLKTNTAKTTSVPWFEPGEDSLASGSYPKYLREASHAIKKGNPKAIVMIGESEVLELPNSSKTAPFEQMVRALYKDGVIDKVMLQGHFLFDFNDRNYLKDKTTPRAPTNENELSLFKEATKARLRVFMIDIGIPTGMNELDVIFSNNTSIPDEGRPFVAANIEVVAIEAYLEILDEVKKSSLSEATKQKIISLSSLYHWGLDKETAWKQYPDYQNDYSLYANGKPLPSVYAISRIFFDRALRRK